MGENPRMLKRAHGILRKWFTNNSFGIGETSDEVTYSLYRRMGAGDVQRLADWTIDYSKPGDLASMHDDLIAKIVAEAEADLDGEMDGVPPRPYVCARKHRGRGENLWSVLFEVSSLESVCSFHEDCRATPLLGAACWQNYLQELSTIVPGEQVRVWEWVPERAFYYWWDGRVIAETNGFFAVTVGFATGPGVRIERVTPRDPRPRATRMERLP